MKITNEHMRLYAVTDTMWLGDRDFYEEIEDVLKNGATFLQLREKNDTHETIVEKAKKIKPIAEKYGVPFVIDDDIYAAIEADVDGVHIGQSDMDYECARKLLGPDKIIGMTAKTVEQAVKAQKLGADYIGAGAVFHTDTKKDAEDMSREQLMDITSAVDIPVVAIGGITYDNCDYLKGTGVAGIAVVSAIFAKENPGEATKNLYIKTGDVFGYKHNIIFDMDGTLVDSMPYWKGASREYMNSRGITIPEDFDKRTSVMNLKDFAEYVRDEFGINTTVEEITKEAVDIMNSHYANDINAKPGMVELVKREHACGSKMTIFTASEHKSVETAMNRLGILDCFDSITTVYDIGIGKSDPESYRTVASKLGFNPENTWIFEDVLHGVKSAKESGFKVCGVYDSDSSFNWESIKKLADRTMYIK